MCNLFNQSTNQEAIRALSGYFRDMVGNMEPSQDIYPDRMAPIVRNGTDGVRELAATRWGMPSSSQALFEAAKTRAGKLEAKGKPFDFNELLKMEPDGGTTNIRNTKSKHWLRWLGVSNRAVVPVTSFAEPDPARRAELGYTPNAWFALDDSRPLFFFAGAWLPQWESVRKVKEGLIKADLFAFLTTEPNGVVGPIHQKAMPVILTTKEEIELWLSGSWDEAKILQRPLPDHLLKQVPAPPKLVA